MKHSIDPDEISNELSGLNELLEIIWGEAGSNADFSKKSYFTGGRKQWKKITLKIT